jgi:hypothetical protein
MTKGRDLGGLNLGVGEGGGAGSAGSAGSAGGAGGGGTWLWWCLWLFPSMCGWGDGMTLEAERGKA